MTPDPDRQPCGCPLDYHLADCPHLTREHENAEPPEPDEFAGPWDASYRSSQ